MATKTKRTRHPIDTDSGSAFVPDVARTHEALVDDEAEAFAEEFIATATSAEFVGEDARDETTTEELGGPFLVMAPDPESKAFRFVTDDDTDT